MSDRVGKTEDCFFHDVAPISSAVVHFSSGKHKAEQT